MDAGLTEQLYFLILRGCAVIWHGGTAGKCPLPRAILPVADPGAAVANRFSIEFGVDRCPGQPEGALEPACLNPLASRFKTRRDIDRTAIFRTTPPASHSFLRPPPVSLGIWHARQRGPVLSRV